MGGVAIHSFERVITKTAMDEENPAKKHKAYDTKEGEIKRIIPAEAKQYAAFANASYKRTWEQRVKAIEPYVENPHEWQIDRILSDQYSTVFVHPQSNRVVTSYKGTNPADVDDLISDAAIGVGAEDTDKRFARSRRHFNKVLQKYSGYDHILASHSLGAALNNYVNEKYQKQIKAVYNYNRGVGRREVDLPINPFSPVPIVAKKVLQRTKRVNVTDYRIEGDPISALVSDDGFKQVFKASPETNPHSVTQFLL